MHGKIPHNKRNQRLNPVSRSQNNKRSARYQLRCANFRLELSCVLVFCVFLCCSVCWFLYGPFYHGALKLDISTLFTTFFLWTSLKFILKTYCVCLH